MFESIMKIIKKITKKDDQTLKSKDAAKERLHLVLMQDRANVSADFLDLMKQEIIEVIKKYIDIDESAMDVRLTNKENSDGTNGAPALYANIPILNIKEETRQNAKVETSKVENTEKKENNVYEEINFNQENIKIEEEIIPEVETSEVIETTEDPIIKEEIKIENIEEKTTTQNENANHFEEKRNNNFQYKNHKKFKKHKNKNYYK